MTPPRRHLIRPTTPTAVAGQRQRQLQNLRMGLERAGAALPRWQTRLKRAFHAVAKHQKQVTRLERQLARMEES